MYQVNSTFILQEEDFNRIRTRNNLQPNTNLIKEANPSSSCKLDLPLNLDLIQQMSLVHNVKARFKPKPIQNHHLQLGSLAWHFVFSGKISKTQQEYIQEIWRNRNSEEYWRIAKKIFSSVCSMTNFNLIPRCCLCSCIPLCIDSLQAVTHTCPNCNAFIGRYKGGI